VDGAVIDKPLCLFIAVWWSEAHRELGGLGWLCCWELNEKKETWTRRKRNRNARKEGAREKETTEIEKAGE
jgi:hypothetical protein